jgi:hypothetical protein
MAAVLALGVIAPFALAQDERPPAERDEVDPARLEALVERRLEQTERQHERLREIRDRLENGESAAAIMADLRERGELGLLGEWGRGGERDGQRGPREGGDRDPQDVSPEDFELWRNRVVAFFERHAPEMAQRLREEGDEEHARRAIVRLRREVDRLIELRDQGSDEFEPALERLRNGMRIADVLGRVREASTAGTLTPEMLRTLRADLTEVVSRQYDAQLDARAKWLERMGQRLRGAVEKLERERAERSQRIEAEVQRMLDRAVAEKDEHGPDGPQRRGPR